MKGKLSQWISILLVLLAACTAALGEAEGVSRLPDGVYSPDTFSSFAPTVIFDDILSPGAV